MISENRMIGAVGIFSSGNNLLAHLLKESCCKPEQLEIYGNDMNKFTKQIIRNEQTGYNSFHGVKCQSSENLFDKKKGDQNTSFKPTTTVHFFHVMLSDRIKLMLLSTTFVTCKHASCLNNELK